MGRPSDYSEDTAARVCEQIAMGRSLVSICSGDDFPSLSSIYKWLNQHKDFADMYTRAREDQADTMADQIVDIADEECTTVRAEKHPTAKADDDGMVEVVFDSTAVARNRLRVDARKWVAAKLKPKKYGERQQMEHSGPDGGPIETVTRIELVPGDGNGAG